MGSGSFTSTLLRISAGPLIWAAHFLGIYSFTALACARRLENTGWLGVGMVPLVIGILTAIAVAALLTTIWTALRSTGRRADDATEFVHWTSAAFAGLALVAVLWEALPVLMVPICG